MPKDTLKMAQSSSSLNTQEMEPPPRLTSPYQNFTASSSTSPRKLRTDYDEQLIPRAIYNDPISELLLRGEGASGRVVDAVGDLKPLKKRWENSIKGFEEERLYVLSDDPPTAPSVQNLPKQSQKKSSATQKSTSTQSLPARNSTGSHSRANSASNPSPATVTTTILAPGQAVQAAAVPSADIKGDNTGTGNPSADERTVIFTEQGITILNFTQVVPIKPIEKPPPTVFACPTDQPVYNPSKHKSLPPTFPMTKRYATHKNVLGVTPKEIVEKSFKVVEDMRKKEEELIRENMLRYTKWYDDPPPRPPRKKPEPKSKAQPKPEEEDVKKSDEKQSGEQEKKQVVQQKPQQAQPQKQKQATQQQQKQPPKQTQPAQGAQKPKEGSPSTASPAASAAGTDKEEKKQPAPASKQPAQQQSHHKEDEAQQGGKRRLSVTIPKQTGASVSTSSTTNTPPTQKTPATKLEAVADTPNKEPLKRRPSTSSQSVTSTTTLKSDQNATTTPKAQQQHPTPAKAATPAPASGTTPAPTKQGQQQTPARGSSSSTSDIPPKSQPTPTTPAKRQDSQPQLDTTHRDSPRRQPSTDASPTSSSPLKESQSTPTTLDTSSASKATFKSLDSSPKGITASNISLGALGITGKSVGNESEATSPVDDSKSVVETPVSSNDSIAKTFGAPSPSKRKQQSGEDEYVVMPIDAEEEQAREAEERVDDAHHEEVLMAIGTEEILPVDLSMKEEQEEDQVEHVSRVASSPPKTSPAANGEQKDDVHDVVVSVESEEISPVSLVSLSSSKKEEQKQASPQKVSPASASASSPRSVDSVDSSKTAERVIKEEGGGSDGAHVETSTPVEKTVTAASPVRSVKSVDALSPIAQTPSGHKSTPTIAATTPSSVTAAAASPTASATTSSPSPTSAASSSTPSATLTTAHLLKPKYVNLSVSSQTLGSGSGIDSGLSTATLTTLVGGQMASTSNVNMNSTAELGSTGSSVNVLRQEVSPVRGEASEETHQSAQRSGSPTAKGASDTPTFTAPPPPPTAPLPPLPAASGSSIGVVVGTVLESGASKPPAMALPATPQSPGMPMEVAIPSPTQQNAAKTGTPTRSSHVAAAANTDAGVATATSATSKDHEKEDAKPSPTKSTSSDATTKSSKSSSSKVTNAFKSAFGKKKKDKKEGGSGDEESGSEGEESVHEKAQDKEKEKEKEKSHEHHTDKRASHLEDAQHHSDEDDTASIKSSKSNKFKIKAAFKSIVKKDHSGDKKALGGSSHKLDIESTSATTSFIAPEHSDDTETYTKPVKEHDPETASVHSVSSTASSIKSTRSTKQKIKGSLSALAKPFKKSKKKKQKDGEKGEGQDKDHEGESGSDSEGEEGQAGEHNAEDTKHAPAKTHTAEATTNDKGKDKTEGHSKSKVGSKFTSLTNLGRSSGSSGSLSKLAETKPAKATAGPMQRPLGPGPNSGRFLNAMDMIKLQQRNGASSSSMSNLSAPAGGLSKERGEVSSSMGNLLAKTSSAVAVESGEQALGKMETAAAPGADSVAGSTAQQSQQEVPAEKPRPVLETAASVDALAKPKLSPAVTEATPAPADSATKVKSSPSPATATAETTVTADKAKPILGATKSTASLASTATHTTGTNATTNTVRDKPKPAPALATAKSTTSLASTPSKSGTVASSPLKPKADEKTVDTAASTTTPQPAPKALHSSASSASIAATDSAATTKATAPAPKPVSPATATATTSQPKTLHPSASSASIAATDPTSTTKATAPTPKPLSSTTAHVSKSTASLSTSASSAPRDSQTGAIASSEASKSGISASAASLATWTDPKPSAAPNTKEPDTAKPDKDITKKHVPLLDRLKGSGSELSKAKSHSQGDLLDSGKSNNALGSKDARTVSASAASLTPAGSGGPSATAAAGAAKAQVDFNVLTQKVTIKTSKCDIKVENFELQCVESGKGKSPFHFFPIELRRVVTCKCVGNGEVDVRACTIRKGGREGSKFKKINIKFEKQDVAEKWADALISMVYGGENAESDVIRDGDVNVAQPDFTKSGKILVLVDKFEGQSATKLVDKFIKPVWDAVLKPYEVKAVQFNEFSVSNVLASQENVSKLSNIVCLSPDFGSKLCQVLVRNQYTENPVNLPCEHDPVDAALAILRSSVVGSSKRQANTLHVTAFAPKREEN
ncbi:hypothetical protein HK102_012009, partial [Quaeritorhiza haematococci]